MTEAYRIGALPPKDFGTVHRIGTGVRPDFDEWQKGHLIARRIGSQVSKERPHEPSDHV